MTNRENALAILQYQNHDALPVVHFGYWQETLQKWADEGHISKDFAANVGDGNEWDKKLDKIIGFDFDWYSCVSSGAGLNPGFERKVIEITPEGYRKVFNSDGVIVLEKEGIVSIPVEVDHMLKDRESYETYYKPRLQPGKFRIQEDYLKTLTDPAQRSTPLGIHCGSMFGDLRNWMGVEGVSYLYADDEDLYAEIIADIGNLIYEQVKMVLETGAKFDFAHFWEDICFKNGPLVTPDVFAQYVGPQYKRITDLVKSYGINIISLDCDGCIDSLLPIWFANGVNTMFPIEVGTWDASIAPWRAKYGKELRGVGGMNKTVFAYDYAAIDREIERLKPLVALGGYIPCPDHRIAPDAKFENVQYYCEQVREKLQK